VLASGLVVVPLFAKFRAFKAFLYWVFIISFKKAFSDLKRLNSAFVSLSIIILSLVPHQSVSKIQYHLGSMNGAGFGRLA